MKKTVKSALSIKEAQLFLDECTKTHELVSVVALKQDGTRVEYSLWQVLSTWWTRGTFDLKNPKNGQIRKIRFVLLFFINNHPVYI